MACALIDGSIRSSNSTTIAESPAVTIRMRQRVQELPMNAAEAAVRHHDDEVAVAMLADDRGDDVVERVGGPRRLALRSQRPDELRQRQPPGVGQLRSKYRRQQHVVCAGECAREIVLKDAAA